MLCISNTLDNCTVAYSVHLQDRPPLVPLPKNNDNIMDYLSSETHSSTKFIVSRLALIINLNSHPYSDGTNLSKNSSLVLAVSE